MDPKEDEHQEDDRSSENDEHDMMPSQQEGTLDVFGYDEVFDLEPQDNEIDGGDSYSMDEDYADDFEGDLF